MEEIDVYKNERQSAFSSITQYGSSSQKWTGKKGFPYQEDSKSKLQRSPFLNRLKKGLPQIKKAKSRYMDLVEMKNAVDSMQKEFKEKSNFDIAKASLFGEIAKKGKQFVRIKDKPDVIEKEEQILREKLNKIKGKKRELKGKSIYERHLGLKKIEKELLEERVQHGINYWMDRESVKKEYEKIDVNTLRKRIEDMTSEDIKKVIPDRKY